MFHKARALLDNGSQINIISEKLSQKLKINTRTTNVGFVGVGQAENNSNKIGKYQIASVTSNYSSEIYCYVLPSITSHIPTFSFSMYQLGFPLNVQLVDPNFNVSSEVDILIGADTFWNILLTGRFAQNKIHFTETKLGWILGGVLDNRVSSNVKLVSCHVSQEQSRLENIMAKFWKDEGIGENTKSYTKDEIACESHFLKTYKRDDLGGRFIVELPFKEPLNLGKSYRTALMRLNNLETRFLRNPKFYLDYKDGMHEYITSGILEKIPFHELNCKYSYY